MTPGEAKFVELKLVIDVRYLDVLFAFLRKLGIVFSRTPDDIRAEIMGNDNGDERVH